MPKNVLLIWNICVVELSALRMVTLRDAHTRTISIWEEYQSPAPHGVCKTTGNTQKSVILKELLLL